MNEYDQMPEEPVAAEEPTEASAAIEEAIEPVAAAEPSIEAEDPAMGAAAEPWAPAKGKPAPQYQAAGQSAGHIPPQYLAPGQKTYDQVPPQYQASGQTAYGQVPPQYQAPGRTAYDQVPPQYQAPGYMAYGQAPPQYQAPGQMAYGQAPPQYQTPGQTAYGQVPPQYQTPQIDPNQQYYYTRPQTLPGDGYATTSLVCGILGLIISFFGIILAIVAIVQGNKAKALGYPGGKATAGIFMGTISIVLYGILLFFIILAALL